MIGVLRVEFLVTGTLQASTNATPAAFYWGWDTEAISDSSYTLTAKAYDEAGNIGPSASVVVSVQRDHNNHYKGWKEKIDVRKLLALRF